MISRKYLELRSIIVTFIVISNFIAHLKILKKTTHIYINSDQFGHSIADSLIFIEAFGQKSLVISLGSEINMGRSVERNRFFDKCLGNNILGIYFPKQIINNDVWNLTAPITKFILKIFLVILRNSECLIHLSKNEFLRDAYLRVIPNKIDMNFLDMDCEELVEYLDFKIFTGRRFLHPLGYLSFLLNNGKVNTGLVDNQISNCLARLKHEGLLNMPFVCLAIRRSSSPYNSEANYYFDAIDLITQAGFMVGIIGDRKYFFDNAKKNNYSLTNIMNYPDLGDQAQKAFDIFGIENCEFVVGDQGGVWSLVKVFNKPGLMVNACPTSQLQYNVESLPKRWIYESTGLELLDANEIFGDLFFKWTQASKIIDSPQKPNTKSFNFEISDSLVSVANDNDTVIEVLKKYIEDRVYLNPRKMQRIVTQNFPENIFLRIAQNSCYSENYINKLTGWKKI